MNKYALELTQFAHKKGHVTFGDIEISLYHYNGKDIEVWFNTKRDRIEQLHFITGTKINPYLKFVNPLYSN